MREIPSDEDVRSALRALTYSQIVRLAALSDVPFRSLLKIRGGEIVSPRLATARKFWPHIAAAGRWRKA